jgi:hypothetical protein
MARCRDSEPVSPMASPVEYGFDMLGLDEIRVRTMETNAATRGIMERKFGFDKIMNLIKSDIAPDSPGAGGEYENVGDAPLGRMERYWKLMSDWVEEESTGGWQCATASTDRSGGRG